MNEQFKPNDCDCSSVIIDILKNRLPAIIHAMELPCDTKEFMYFIKLIQLEPGDEFVKVVFTTDFNNKDYVWYFRAGLNG